MISLAPQSVFPSFHEEWKNIYTKRGKVEKPTSKMKACKQKRAIMIVTIILTAFGLNTIFIFWKTITWSNILLFINVPILVLVNLCIPSFYIFANGLYYDERFIRWEAIKEFSVSPVAVGSEGHGMFENSTSYTEIKLYMDNKRKSAKPVYIDDLKAVESIVGILQMNGIKEWNEDKKKQPAQM